MDPISLAASVITLIGTVSFSIKTLQRLKSGPAGLDVLLDDIDALQPVLMEIDPILKNSKHQILLRNSRLPRAVLAAHTNLVELDETLITILLRRNSATSVTRVCYVAHFKLHQRLEELQRVLLTIRIKLTAMLDVFAASRSIQIKSSVEESAQTTREFEDRVLRAFLEHRSMLREIHNRMQSVFANGIDRTTDSLDATPTKQSRTHLRRPTWRRVSLVEADALDYRPRRCVISCIYRCHRCFRIRSPEVLQKILGTFFVKLASLYILCSCDNGTCRQRSQSLLRLTYFFPHWLLMRMISAT
ncbi:hypothetical protein BJ170DRAFT_269441 [Xylariales sp. AK1849]|nr:hypothetical protein BJ170DRAFT_269441 [Xylariales sp. AK1849]